MNNYDNNQPNTNRGKVSKENPQSVTHYLQNGDVIPLWKPKVPLRGP